MNKNKSNEIINILKTIIINPKPELDFNNNYELIISVILSAQTTDKRVNIVTKDLYKKYNNYNELANAKIEDVTQIIKPLGLAKSKANNIIELSKIIHNNYNDILPNTLDELIKLPGVGRKTASVVLALGFNIPAMPVDTHLYRMAIRFGYIKKTESVKDAEESFKKYIPKEEWIEAHHLFLLFGRYHCKAISPLCDSCKLKDYCNKK